MSGKPDKGSIVNGRTERPLLGITYTCGAAFVLSVQDGIIKWLDADYSVFQLLLVRSFVVVTIIVAVYRLRLKTTEFRLSTKRPLEHGLRIGASVTAFALFFSAISLAPLAEIVGLTLTAPLLVALLSGPILGERTGVAEFVGVGVGFCGVLVMTTGTGSNLSPTVTVMCLGAATAYALFVLLTRRLSDTESSEILVIYASAGTFLVCLPVSIHLWISPPTTILLMMLGLGVVSTIGHWLLVKGFSSAPAFVVAPFDYTALIWTALIGFVFWNEVPTLSVTVGASLIVLAGLVIIYTNYRRIRQRRLSRSTSERFPD